MATFLKLSDRSINVSVVLQLRKGTERIPDPNVPFRHYDPDTITVPALFLDIAGKQTLTYKFDSEEARDVEYERIDSVLFPKPQVLFRELLINPDAIQALQVKWHNLMNTSLDLDIRMAGGKSYQVSIVRDDKAEWDRAEQLVAHFGLSIPKTMKEWMADKYDEGGNLKPDDSLI